MARRQGTRAAPVRGGFTLVEALLASAILALVIVSVTIPFTSASQNEQAGGRQTLATSLAEEMMEEILSKPFYDPNGYVTPGPDPGESSRGLYDNLDDYHGYSEAAGSIRNAAGDLCTDPLSYGLSRSVAAEYVYVSGQDTSGPPTFIRVTVTVSYRNQPVVRLVRLAYCVP